MYQAPAQDDASQDETVVDITRQWLEKAVIGLNLCPFAKAVHVKKQIRYVVSHAKNIDTLLEELTIELETLAEASPDAIDTTLLIHPWALSDFLDYNDFLDIADAVVEELELDGILQVASFHPDYQFEGTEADDIENFSNRAPFPTLHLLREDSIERAVEAFPDAGDIYERNIETLKKLGHDGWNALGIGQKKH
ncbi:DUF1415 domain-containing protein [Crenobacter cavernae]|uniref:DUF1415 domain-containing protein n=1 Tax=Crenobacter cavernae TaxID=2290923 RepID=A0A345Y9L0_9NEIS|nr:DUF1415 domain-containing protein [Crenobacter cavernae]AXK40612.1 DUF1415 domain-containing protein [Crenobacter cavernae]